MANIRRNRYVLSSLMDMAYWILFSWSLVSAGTDTPFFLDGYSVLVVRTLKIKVLSVAFNSTWSSIINGVNSLKDKEEKKHISVADKMCTSISFSFRRPVRGGVESQQHDHLSALLDSVILSNMKDRWFWDLNGDGVFRVKDVRIWLDEAFLPKMEVPTRWIKSISIKVNVFLRNLSSIVLLLDRIWLEGMFRSLLWLVRCVIMRSKILLIYFLVVS
nr:RNA-directed DNA polymerase, eukaryota [Tanacetum cinerariifolium]